MCLRSEARFDPTRRRSAFTLIELLVVVSIVALLVTILLPALKKTREQAKTTMCLANLKGIATAGITYAAADASEFAVPVHRRHGLPPFLTSWHIGAYHWGGKAGVGEAVSSPDPLDSLWGTANGSGPRTRPLNAVLYKNGFTDYHNDPGPNQINWKNDATLDLPGLHCPSDRGYTGYHLGRWKKSGLPSFDHYGTSYAASVLPESVHSDFISSLTPFYIPLSRVPNPTKTVLYLENAGRFGWMLNAEEAGSPDCGSHAHPSEVRPGAARPIDGSHGRTFHFVTAFVDAHAAVVKMDGIILPQPRLHRYPHSQVHTESAAGGDYDIWNRWKCDILRGVDCADRHPAGHREQNDRRLSHWMGPGERRRITLDGRISRDPATRSKVPMTRRSI